MSHDIEINEIAKYGAKRMHNLKHILFLVNWVFNKQKFLWNLVAKFNWQCHSEEIIPKGRKKKTIWKWWKIQKQNKNQKSKLFFFFWNSFQFYWLNNTQCNHQLSKVLFTWRKVIFTTTFWILDLFNFDILIHKRKKNQIQN